MSTSNISQVLLRNSEMLGAKTPLFINLMADGFIEQYILENPNSKIHCHNTNYIDYMAINSKVDQAVVKTSFDSEYKSESKHDLVIINFPKSKDELAFTLSFRKRINNLGIGIFTGQTSPQAPHSDDAVGKSFVAFSPNICGEIIFPIGPG